MEVPVGVAGEKFVRRKIEKALYGTAWDGTVVVEMDADGHAHVVGSRGPITH